MTTKRVLIIANTAVADRPAGVPEVVRHQVLEAEQVRVVAPMLTTRLESWASDIDRAAHSANERMRAIVHRIEMTGHRGERGLGEKARARFRLPITELLIDDGGSVVCVKADGHA